MKRKMFWFVLVLIAAGLLIVGRLAFSRKQEIKTVPASVSKIEGTDRVRLALLPEAASRLDIKTAQVRGEPAGPVRKFPGEVISISRDLNRAILQVELTESDVKKVRRDVAAAVLPLARDSNAPRIEVKPVEEPANLGLYGRPGTLYYETRDGNHSLVHGQLVFVELNLSVGGDNRRVIAYSAVLYDANGATWVYTNPEQDVFIREPIQIDVIAGDEAILRDGPPAGTAVVTVGVAELYGTEFGVGK